MHIHTYVYIYMYTCTYIRLVPSQVGDGRVAFAQVHVVVSAILPSIRRLWMCAARAAVVFLFMCLEARCFNRLAEPGHRPCGSDAGLWPLIVKDGPLFIADFAI